ncbi:MAG: WXG100 family type VII secretion target [Actinomycetota bacterium]
MATGELLVTFGSLSQAQADIQSVSNSLNQQLGDLKSYLAPMVSTWTGAASSEYQAKQAQWDSAAAELNQILSRIGGTVGQALANYESTEKTNQSMWG